MSEANRSTLPLAVSYTRMVGHYFYKEKLMAKKTVNKTALIKDAMAEKPDATPV